MGWDAHSSAKTKFSFETGKIEFEDVSLAQAFKEKAELVKRLAGSVDGFFENGSLDVSNCAYMLEKATGESCWSDNGWTAQKVEELNATSDWSFPYEEDEFWAYLSAKEFLSVCAENNLAISFSY